MYPAFPQSPALPYSPCMFSSSSRVASLWQMACTAGPNSGMPTLFSLIHLSTLGSDARCAGISIYLYQMTSLLDECELLIKLISFNIILRWICCICRSLALLVDVIRLCKIYKYEFTENSDLIEALSNRVSELNSHSLESLVITASSDRSSSSSASARWSNVLKKMKGKFSQ